MAVQAGKSESAGKAASKKQVSREIPKQQHKSNGVQKSPPRPQTASKEQLLRAYRDMLRARLNDEKTIVLYKQNKCHFQIGVAGHEAVQVAAAHVFRAGQDWFYPYYRDMALCAALGMTDREFMLNAMNKQADPNSHGREMPMHYGHKDLRIINQSSPTGTQFLQAVGCAMAAKLRGRDEVVYVSAGEGTCAQGDFHEALNWAAREKLPVVFLIENNEYAISVHVSEQHADKKGVIRFARSYENLEALEIDGTDYPAALEAFSRAHARARAGAGPSLIEAHVPRLQSHSISDNHLKYRSQQDIDKEKQRCPIARFQKLLREEASVADQELRTIEKELKAAIDAAAEWAEAQPDCDPATALDHNYVDNAPQQSFSEGEAKGEELYLVDAINRVLDDELSANPEMVIFGQDVAHGKGGVFTVTAGLTAKHGTSRVFNSPLAESSIIGVAIGMATVGMKPVAEVQFGDYVWTGMMQIRNELAMLLYRSGGDFSCPAVIRIPVGGYIHGACYHSQNIEATFAHFPGLYIAYPSNATDAQGLLRAAIRGKDPVLFLEHKGLYRQVYAKGPSGDRDFVVPLGKAKVVREGADATVVTWGALVQKSLLAARSLESEGFSVEVIDLRSIVPLDIESIVASVVKTNRVLIAHEDTMFMGFGAEIAAHIASECFQVLDAPVKRLGMKYAAAVPHSPALENVILPQNEDVVSALRDLLQY